MQNCVEIRWHGRGGQGAKTAALLLADVAFKTGKYVQGFPEYGPERMGAPITAYNRISTDPIRVHSNIYDPDLINTAKDKSEISEKLHGYKGAVYTIDAKKVSKACLGRYFPNTPMLAGIVKVSGVMEWDDFYNEMRASFMHKFSSKPEVIDGNMNALKMAFDEVR